MKKILIVSTEILKDKYSCSLITTKVITELSKVHQVDVLAEWPSIINFENKINQLWLTQEPFFYKFSKNKILRKVLTKFLNFNFEKFVRTNSLRNYLKKINLDSYDYIIAFAGGDYFITHRIVSELKNCKAKRWGYIHDPYPVNTYPYPYFNANSKGYEKEFELYYEVFNNLDILWFPSNLLATHMQTFYGFSNNSIYVFPHILPKIVFNNEINHNFENLLKEFNVQPNKYYLHAGTLLGPRKIDTIIKAFVEMQNENKIEKELKLLFVGNINYEHQHLTNFKNVILHNNRVSYDKVNILCKYAKALLIIEHDGEFSPFLPGKFPEYIALNKPLMHFGPKNSEINFICKHINNTFSAPLNSLPAIKQVLINQGQNVSNNNKIIEYFNINNLNSIF